MVRLFIAQNIYALRVMKSEVQAVDDKKNVTP